MTELSEQKVLSVLSEQPAFCPCGYPMWACPWYQLPRNFARSCGIDKVDCLIEIGNDKFRQTAVEEREGRQS